MKLIIVGTGRMGQLIRQKAEDAGHEVLAMGDVLSPGDVPALSAKADAIIDFSHPDNLDWILSLSGSAALVEGTTGFDPSHTEQLRAASVTRPVFYASNYSLGVAVLQKLASDAAKMLRGFDIEIVETHHNRKADAPSGTALSLLDAVDPESSFDRVYGRHGRPGPRTREIGIHAIRGGTVAGDHDVIFFGPDEVVRLSHHAGSREIFVNGALKAAEFLQKQQPGLYTMDELLEETAA
ncbi:4-hydroxy-tetrahydrodipicolinate reductase [Faecalibaculum rodentium]|jgi:4-hydroxy-tetrahydrodipicolinate reductase|uniref:4-hydroxy-tetrahydrodipicolinate reductase n=1 Tax=Faecalibaculum rodentium TaxID=1702221 RepID=UPI00256EE878|nr:4-hydroxy-tetrahydrodipicolinate reductase [Faecalibaculum rodentium]